MARAIRRFVDDPRPCAYLPSRQAELEYRILVDVSATELEVLLERGWRRFGPAYFRPRCERCSECVSLRIVVANFRPSRSQRRASRAHGELRVEIGAPKTDSTRLALHQAWHQGREATRGWEPSALTGQDYATQFAFPSVTGREMAWYQGENLVAVSLIDLTPTAVSAAYFYYSPAIAAGSPGVANVLRCVDLARATGRRYVYLGYRVLDCPSLRYKANFTPHELLQGRPGDEEAPAWTLSGE